jgi:hypothetical protein
MQSAPQHPERETHRWRLSLPDRFATEHEFATFQ